MNILLSLTGNCVWNTVTHAASLKPVATGPRSSISLRGAGLFIQFATRNVHRVLCRLGVKFPRATAGIGTTAIRLGDDELTAFREWQEARKLGVSPGTLKSAREGRLKRICVEAARKVRGE